MSQTVQAIVAILLVAGVALLWKISEALESQNRTLSQMRTSLGKLDEIYDRLAEIKYMLTKGEYNAPKPPGTTMEELALFTKTLFAQHELDKLGQR
jgi:hypothetical protein